MTTPPTPLTATPLGPAGQRVLHALTNEFGARDAEVAHLCQVAAQAWERAEQAREVVAREGLIIHVGKEAVYAHPAVKIESAAQATFLAALRVLRQPARRAKPGRPSMGEVVAGRQAPMSKLAMKYFGGPEVTRRRASKYISG